jgi:biopolymer transport protein ExbD
VCLIAIGIYGIVVQQDPAVPAPRPGIQVQLPVSSLAAAMPEADKQDTTVVTVTAEGNLYLGVQPIQIGALAGLSVSTVYVKADARASYQHVLSVVSALSSHPLVLLTQAKVKAEPVSSRLPTVFPSRWGSKWL